MANMHNFPDVVMTPKNNGEYLLTPPSWSGDEYQSLYNVSDESQLMAAAAEAFQMDVEDLDECNVVTVEVHGEIVTVNRGKYRINDEGFLVYAD